MFVFRKRSKREKQGGYVPKNVEVDEDAAKFMEEMEKVFDEEAVQKEKEDTEITNPVVDEEYYGYYRTNPSKEYRVRVERGGIYRVYLDDYDGITITTTPDKFKLVAGVL